MPYRVVNWSLLPDGTPFEATVARANTYHAARRLVEGAVNDEAGHWLEHCDDGGHVGVAPVGEGAFSVQLFDRNGKLEAWRLIVLLPPDAVSFEAGGLRAALNA